MSAQKKEKDIKQELNFTILHTNDEHSALMPAPFADYHPEKPNPTVGGIARVASVVKKIRKEKKAEKEPVLLISGGDFMGGSPFSWLAFRGMAAELSLMMATGYDLVTLGNHELDFGADILARYLKAAGYPEASSKLPIITSNMQTPPDHPLSSMGIKKTFVKILENGLKLGFFGLFGKDSIAVTAFKESVEFFDQVESAKTAIEELRKNDVDLIIAINHTGLKEDIEMLRHVSGIDIIISGHCHLSTEEPIISGDTIVVEALELFKKLGVLELAYNRETKKVRLRNSETGRPYLIDINDKIPTDSEIASKLEDYSDKLGDMVADLTDGRIKKISQVIAVSDFDIPAYLGKESPMGNFVTDAMRVKAEEALGKKVDFAFFASGIIRGSLYTGKMPYSKGQINFFELADRVSLGKGFDDVPGFPLISAYFTAGEIRKMVDISVFITQYMSEHYFIVGSGIRAKYDFKRAVLRLPFINEMLPTIKGALAVDVFAGKGVQSGKDDLYIPLKKNKQKLYHVVADYPIGIALPQVGDKVFYLKLKPKDEKGNPLSLKDAIIYRNGKELKLWQAVIEYAADQPEGKDGIPRIDDIYKDNTGRFVEGKGTPLYVWPLIISAGLITLKKILKMSSRKNG